MAIERHNVDLANHRDKWLKLREPDITASVVGCLLGVHEYTTILEQWALKAMRMQPDKAQSDAMARGELLEPVAAALLKRQQPTWEITYPVNQYYRDPEARLGATPDIFAVDPKRDGFGVVQTKSVEAGIYRRKWHQEDSIEPPMWIVVQALVEASLTGASWAAVAPLVVSYGITMPVIEIPLNTALMDTIRQKVAEFWTMVDLHRMPDPDYTRDGQALARLFSPVEGETIDLSGDNAIPALRVEDATIKAFMAAYKLRRDAIKAELLGKMRTAEVALYNGEVIATAKTIHKKAYSVKESSYRNVLFKEARQ